LGISSAQDTVRTCYVAEVVAMGLCVFADMIAAVVPWYADVANMQLSSVD